MPRGVPITLKQKEPGKKECNSCNKVKNLEEFSLDRRRNDGRQPYCRDCSWRMKRAGRSFDKKRCPKCGKTKPASDFYRSYVNQSGLSTHCKLCKRIYERGVTSEVLKAKRRGYWIKWRYGLTAIEYDALKSAGCGICGFQTRQGGPGNLTIDHCHRTGKVRGALCHHCNVGIGFLGDDIAKLRAAISYLEKSI